MNLVNGWQFTGLGPYYMKDSSQHKTSWRVGLPRGSEARRLRTSLKGSLG